MGDWHVGILNITELGASCVAKQIIRVRKSAGMRKFGKHLTKENNLS